MKKINIFLLLFSLNAFGEDLMVQRMQDVVNEVSDLRSRYENEVLKNKRCLYQLETQDSGTRSGSKVEKKRIQDLEVENKKLKKTSKKYQVQTNEIKKLQEEIRSLEKQKQRLNASAQILVEKNHSLLEQVNKIKRNKNKSTLSSTSLAIKENSALKSSLKASKKQVTALENKNSLLETKLTKIGKSKVSQSNSIKSQNVELKNLKKTNKRLVSELKTSKTALASVPVLSCKDQETENTILMEALNKCKNAKQKRGKNVSVKKGICTDDNPFPKLLKKDTTPKTKNKVKKIETPTPKLSSTYRIKGESAIYNAINGKLVEVWEDKRSFTSDTQNDTWVKITGYFVNKKWQSSKKTLWVKKENTLKR